MLQREVVILAVMVSWWCGAIRWKPMWVMLCRMKVMLHFRFATKCWWRKCEDCKMTVKVKSDVVVKVYGKTLVVSLMWFCWRNGSWRISKYGLMKKSFAGVVYGLNLKQVLSKVKQWLVGILMEEEFHDFFSRVSIHFSSSCFCVLEQSFYRIIELNFGRNLWENLNKFGTLSQCFFDAGIVMVILV